MNRGRHDDRAGVELTWRRIDAESRAKPSLEEAGRRDSRGRRDVRTTRRLGGYDATMDRHYYAGLRERRTGGAAFVTRNRHVSVTNLLGADIISADIRLDDDVTSGAAVSAPLVDDVPTRDRNDSRVEITRG